MSIRILAFDTATEACSAALMLDNKLLLERFIIAPREHMQHILVMIDSLLEEAGVTLDKLDALAFSRGPGSFTGVRIGLGIAQGLALGADLPLICVSSLETLAEGAWRQTGISQVLTAIDACVGKIYWSIYRRKAGGVWLSEEGEMIAAPKTLAKLSASLSGRWTTAGTGWQTYPALLQCNNMQLITSNKLLPSARDMIPIALYQYYHGNILPATLAEAVYL